jgi:hypothetical protein
MTTPSWMPPLPLPADRTRLANGTGFEYWYDAEQVRQAQLDAVEAYKASLKPVAVRVANHIEQTDESLKMGDVLYRLDDQP